MLRLELWTPLNRRYPAEYSHRNSIWATHISVHLLFQILERVEAQKVIESIPIVSVAAFNLSVVPWSSCANKFVVNSYAFTKAYYCEKELRQYQAQPQEYKRLYQLNRIYESELVHLRKRKVSLRSMLDIIYPRIDKTFKGNQNLYDPIPMEILKRYPHPSLLLSHREDTIVKTVGHRTGHLKGYIERIVHKIYEKAKECYSGCDIDGLHLKISKKGNKHLRCLLYLGAQCNYRLRKEDPLYEFTKKKRQQTQCPLSSKAAYTASAHKLLVIIYSLCKNGTLYHS